MTKKSILKITSNKWLILVFGMAFAILALKISETHVLAAGNTYYVSSTGNDANSGSQTAPYKTFSKAVSMLSPGDTLNVSGTFNTTLNISKSGTASSPISIVGNNAVISLSGTSLANGIVLSGNYLNVSGFDVSGAVSHAILISGTNITFENSSVHNSVTENGSGTCSGTGSWGSAVKLMIGSQNTLIRNNSVYENCGEGIGITRSLNAKVEGNTVRDNFSVNIYIDNSPYSSAIGNNVLCTGIYLRNGRRMTGIAIAEESYSGWGAQRHDNSVINNVVDGCYQGIVSWVPEVTGGEFINGTIIGNTVINGTNGSIVIRSVNQNVTISDNTVYTAIDVSNMAGVTLSNNTISNLPPTSTHSPSPIPSRTPSPIPTKSPSPTPSPTKTPTPVPTKSPSPSPLSITGDVNVDGAVDILDVGIVIDNYEKNPIVYSRADINGDGVVNLTDIGIILTNYGR